MFVFVLWLVLPEGGRTQVLTKQKIHKVVQRRHFKVKRSPFLGSHGKSYEENLMLKESLGLSVLLQLKEEEL